MTPEKPDGPIGLGADDRGPKNRFSLLSHDLRSALSDILGGLRLIESDRLDHSTLEHIDRVKAASEALARLLDKTLTDDFDPTDQSVTRASNFNLADFLDDIRKRWADRAHENGIEFALEATSSLPAIVTLDRVSVDRIIANLVGNAIKFTGAGQVVLSVTCGDDQALCFRLTDDGPGLSEEALERLFQYEGRPTGTDKPGSGLGLFIAKDLSDLIGGELQVANRPEGGVEARLRLPHDTWFDRSLRRSGKQSETRDLDQVDLSGLRILLAEDNKTNQLVATQMLGALGAEFEVASDGLEALELLSAEKFDLALLDIEMPRMSGLELIKAVRAMPAPLSEMPLVALTAYVMREHRERIYGAGADGIIAKPLMSIEELGQSVLSYYNGTKSRTGATIVPFTPAGQATGDVVDRAVFDTLVETIGADSTVELLGKLQADTDTVAEGLGRGRQSLDLAEIRSQTHILISVAGAIGATGLQHIAQRLNTAANREEADEIDALCRECLSGLAELQEFILAEQAKVEPTN